MYVQQGYVFGLVCLYVIKKWLFGVFARQKNILFTAWSSSLNVKNELITLGNLFRQVILQPSINRMGVGS